ncbi:MAG: DUF1674 domain-containing protein [Geminicoccaceae bacterium]
MAERGRGEGGEEGKGADAKAPLSKTSSKSGRAGDKKADATPERVKEVGGPEGPEPTRYGDWEKGGRCSDF